MFEQYITEAGVAGVIIYIVLREVFTFIGGRKKENGSAPVLKSIQELHNSQGQMMVLVQALHSMHDQKDSDGVYIWYVRRSLEDAINQLAVNIDRQTDVFKELVTQLKTERDIARGGMGGK